MDYSLPPRLKKEFDEIADGNMKWNQMVGNFYAPFHDGAETITLENAVRARRTAAGQRSGSGKPVTARMGRYGPMVQIGTADDAEKPASPNSNRRKALKRSA